MSRLTRVFPLCTHPGCEHRRTWPTISEAVEAALREPWVNHSTGHAICACHYPAAQPTFPCDAVLSRPAAWA